MAKKTIRVSDMSGAEIPEGRGATVRITYTDARTNPDGVIRLIFRSLTVAAESLGIEARRGVSVLQTASALAT